MSSDDSREVLTLATGAPVYVQLAATLARSYRWWHGDGSPGFRIVTDRPELVPVDVRRWVALSPVQPGSLGDHFSPKLHLDELAGAAHTLFLDADSLCVGSLIPVFERLKGHAVTVVGGTIDRGEWFGDVARLCAAVGVTALPKFNGGLYYLEAGARAAAIYHTARQLEPRYDALGLVRLRGQPNDELLLALALAMHGAKVVPDDGDIVADPLAFPVMHRVDVLRGGAALVNPVPPNPAHRAWNRRRDAAPRVVHFLGSHISSATYRREAMRLELVVARGWPCGIAGLTATIVRTLPIRFAEQVRRVLRPLYRRWFGVRPIARSVREVGA